MPRTRLRDKLQSHLFWAFDASSALQFPVFTPLFGFSSITAPSIQTEVESFRDGTYLYPRTVVKGATVGAVTFHRAATIFDSDFYDWITLAIYGQRPDTEGILGSAVGAFLENHAGEVRRNICVIQMTNINSTKGTAAVFTAIAAAALASGSLGVAATVGVAGLGGVVGIGPFEFAARLPARAWILHQCLPMSYKSASDFDASTPSISLMELTIQPEFIEELNLGV